MSSNASARKTAIREKIVISIAEMIREERLKRNLTLTEVAGRAGLNRQTVAFIEKQERTPTIDTLLRIFDVYELKLEDVIRNARARAA